MRTLSQTTLDIQAGDSYVPIVQVTIGGNAFISSNPGSGLVAVETMEEGQSYRATIDVKPPILAAIHPEILRWAIGKQVNITWGLAGALDTVRSAPLFVVGVSGLSEPGNVIARFDCVGWWELLSASRVVRDPADSDAPPPVWPADTTVRSILNEILVGRGNLWLDEDDGVINTYRPYFEADGLESTLTTVRNLLDMTTSYIRLRDDGFHIINPLPTSDLTHTYELDGHTFFKRSDSVKAIIPNRIVMAPSLPSLDDAPDFIGVALDQDSIDLLGFLDLITVDEGITSEGEANARAYYIMQKLRAEGSEGLATVPMHIGQELYDRIAIIDDRIGTVPIHHFVGTIKRVWEPGRYFMELGLGALMPHLSGLITSITPGQGLQPAPISVAPVITTPVTTGPVFGPPEPPGLPVSPWERIAIRPSPPVYTGPTSNPPVPEITPYPTPTPSEPTPTYPPTITPSPTPSPPTPEIPWWEVRR